ncbi:MAG: type I restriction enzyme HsdR N-terminal domain-containing protein [bacterium]
MSRASLASLLEQHGVDADVEDGPLEDADEVDIDEGDSEVGTESGSQEERMDFVPRLYELYRTQQGMQAQLATLHGMVARLSGADSGEAGRVIAVTDPGAVHTLDGKACFIDLARGCPVLDKPEERVRQCVLQHLVQHLGFPIHLLDSEHRLPRDQDRADIVVHVPQPDGSGSRYLAVIECKAPEVPLDDDVQAQAERYAAKLDAQVYGVTDGRVIKTWHRSQDGWTAVTCFPNLAMLLGRVQPADLVSPTASIERPEFGEIDDVFFGMRLHEADAIHGPDDFLINLSSLFFDTTDGPEGMSADGWRCDQDRGLVQTSFGNAGNTSHAYSGPYRALILRHEEDGKALVFYRTWITYSSSGAEPYTMLALGIHHPESGRRHHAVQLNLQKAVAFDAEGALLTHSGSLSRGGGGSFKRAGVLAQVAGGAPDLVVDGHIRLGRLPTDRLIEWSDAYPILVRLLRYARAIDGLRTGAD